MNMKLIEKIKNNLAENNFSSSIWDKKKGEIRLYVRQGRTECGFIRFVNNDVFLSKITWRKNEIFSVVEMAKEMAKAEVAPATKKASQKDWEEIFGDENLEFSPEHCPDC